MKSDQKTIGSHDYLATHHAAKTLTVSNRAVLYCKKWKLKCL